MYINGHVHYKEIEAKSLVLYACEEIRHVSCICVHVTSTVHPDCYKNLCSIQLTTNDYSMVAI